MIPQTRPEFLARLRDEPALLRAVIRARYRRRRARRILTRRY